jgi:hypothetical protein
MLKWHNKMFAEVLELRNLFHNQKLCSPQHGSFEMSKCRSRNTCNSRIFSRWAKCRNYVPYQQQTCFQRIKEVD